MRLNYAIVFVSDMAASVEFHRDVLGLSLNYETPDWTEFSTEGATLALHKANAPSSIEVRQNTNMAGQCHPGILAAADLSVISLRTLAPARYLL